MRSNLGILQRIRAAVLIILCSLLKLQSGKPLLYSCLSPSLFSVYLNNLITNLKKSNIACRYGSEYMDVYEYADDLSVMFIFFWFEGDVEYM